MSKHRARKESLGLGVIPWKELAMRMCKHLDLALSPKFKRTRPGVKKRLVEIALVQKFDQPDHVKNSDPPITGIVVDYRKTYKGIVQSICRISQPWLSQSPQRLENGPGNIFQGLSERGYVATPKQCIMLEMSGFSDLLKLYKSGHLALEKFESPT